MADFTDSTRNNRAEVFYNPVPTPLAHHFPRLLADLTCFIEAERDIEHADIWNPAFVNWMSEAEGSRRDLLDRLEDLMALACTSAEDKALHRVIHVIYGLVTSDDDAEFRQLHSMVFRHFWLFRCPWDGPAAQEANRLLGLARTCITGLATLSCLDDGFHDMAA